MNKKIYVTYEDIQRDTQELYNIIRNKTSLNNNFDCIIGVARGGVIPATLLAYKLNIPTFKTIQIKSYDNNDNKIPTNFSSGTLPLLDELNKYNNILIVDDLVDTGKTLQAFKMLYEYLKDIVNLTTNIKFACLYYKQSSEFIPDYYSSMVDDKWIVFPWEN